MDAVIFTAGVGENSNVVREKVLKGFEFLGLYFDESKNNVRGQEAFLTTEESPVKALIIPTNEEVMLARDTVRLSS